VAIAVLALVCYSMGTAAHQRELRATRFALRLLSAGLLLDVLATLCMVHGTESRGLTLHGALGYSALAGTAVETALAWRQRRARGDARVSNGLALWSPPPRGPEQGECAGRRRVCARPFGAYPLRTQFQRNHVRFSGRCGWL